MTLRLHIFLLPSFLLAGLLLTFCNGTTSAKDNKVAVLPSTAKPIELTFTDVNHWVENGNFYLVGIANNTSDEWLQIWARVELSDSTGRLITISGEQSSVVPLLSDAVPPRGRSAFFWGCPLSNLSGRPDSCRMSGAGAIGVQPGPILVVTDIGGVRMIFHEPAPTGDSTIEVERTWRVTGKINNPLDMPAYHPRVEVLVYGTDNRLWFAQSLNPEEEAPPIVLEQKGPLNPKESRKAACNVSYEMLPQRINELKIGRVEMMAYETRHF